MTYGPKVYRDQGGNRQTIASGGELRVQGEIDVESGGDIDIESGGDVDFASGATLTFNGSGVFTAGATRMKKIAKVALAAVDTAGGLFAWANPEGAAIIVTHVMLDVTTFTSGACTVDVGVAADGTTLNDTIIDGASLATAAGVRDSQKDAGTNGAGPTRVSSTQFVTGSVASGASAALVGSAFIEYLVV